jgi:hypothetical protein
MDISKSNSIYMVYVLSYLFCSVRLWRHGFKWVKVSKLLYGGDRSLAQFESGSQDIFCFRT